MGIRTVKYFFNLYFYLWFLLYSSHSNTPILFILQRLNQLQLIFARLISKTNMVAKLNTNVLKMIVIHEIIFKM